MNLHANAPFGPKGRLTMVSRVTEQEWSLTEAAEAAGVSERTACKSQPSPSWPAAPEIAPQVPQSGDKVQVVP